jgi:hypothetical protein
MNQTSLEFLIEKLDNNLDIKHSWRTKQYIEQAKEMEKQQIMNAMDWIMNKYFEFHEQPTTSAREQYYNETFKSK